jgi:ubiquinone/menaquinone biosynthesis C-methylase UbiE
VKLNWAERWVVNNPSRVLQQHLEILWFKKNAPRRSYRRILEFGCGRGAGARLVLQKFEPSLLCAQDLDVEMISKARRYLNGTEKKIVSLSVGDAYRFPFKDGAFDAVFGFGVLHHVPDWQTALLEAARILAPGGVYFMEELYPQLYQNALTKRILLHPTENRFKSGELKTALADFQFEITACLELKLAGLLAVLVKTGA